MLELVMEGERKKCIAENDDMYWLRAIDYKGIMVGRKFSRYNEAEAREAFKHSWVCAFNRCNDSCPKKKSETKLDFDNKQEIKQKLYEISDLNEVLRSFLRAANNSDTDAGITVTGCIRNKIEAALNMVEV